MSGRARFLAAAAGEQLAWVPTLWTEVAELVRQPAPDWWRDPTAATRILGDAAALAGADGQMVCAVDAAVAALAATGAWGDDALDGLAASKPGRAAVALVERLVQAGSCAVVVVLPDVTSLGRRLEAGDPDVAEDAFTDLARAGLEAGADALAVVGENAEDVRTAARRAGALGAFFGRPVLGVILSEAPAGWVEGRPEVPVGFVAEDGAWPDQAVGLALTAGDVSGRWDAAALRAAGGGRP